ncbi:hypothetical protein LCGC14_0499240 [marine sediment metagenome]|uniref:Metal-binding protein n=1 Tax=marine sediment metagenome TaxID=412755 RepID=A0A0F9S9I1_9ZZZZ
MSSGAEHNRGALVAGGLVMLACVVTGVAFDPRLGTIAAVSFLFGVFMLSPDLDLRNSSPTKRWGPLRLLWRFYSKTHAHRGISHSMLFGTLERVLYMSSVLLLIGYCWHGFNVEFFSDVQVMAQAYPLEMLTSFTGMWVANTVHIVQDGM